MPVKLLCFLFSLFIAGLTTAYGSSDFLSTTDHDVTINGYGVEQSWLPTRSEKQQLLAARVNQSVNINDFPVVILPHGSDHKKQTQTVDLKRYELMAPGAKITVIDETGKRNLPIPEMMFFSAPKTGLGFMLDGKTGDVEGLISQDGVRMYITGNLQTGLDFRLDELNKSEEQVSAQCHSALGDQPKQLIGELELSDLSKTLEQNTRGTTLYETVIAVDTDTEWMDGKSDNPSTAMAYINTLFTSMNVFFERDLSLRLLLGDVTLRINTDPYPTEDNISNYLTDFGEYWRVNQGNIPRDFALMLSGQNIGSNSFSGIAWVNAYCNNGFQFGSQTAGSYSVNRIGTNFGAASVAMFVGHELGHNMGSPHTHCYNPLVDQCYNGEASPQNDCFDGTPVCPVGGKGTIMSYCHFGAPSGAGCGRSDEEFHPTVISRINSQIVANFPSCIQSLGSDIIFEDGFE